MELWNNSKFELGIALEQLASRIVQAKTFEMQHPPSCIDLTNVSCIHWTQARHI